MPDRYLKVALIGNPNTGKSTLFNDLTGLKQNTGNFPGVTVDKKQGFHTSLEGVTLEIIDLPGIYSLYPRAGDDKISYQVICDKQHSQHPDKIIVVVDASNLKRNLLLLTQVIDLDIPVVLALNMMDIVRKNGIILDIDALASTLGIPVIPINARGKEGLGELILAINKVKKPEKSKWIQEICQLSPQIIKEVVEDLSLEIPYKALQYIHHFDFIDSLKESEKSLIRNSRNKYGFDSTRMQTQETILRYSYISKIIKACQNQLEEPTLVGKSSKIDKILTHKFWGLIIFIFILFVLFQAIFTFAQYPMDLIDHGFSWFANIFRSHLPNNAWSSLWIDGVLAGLRGVVIFLPQILILFAFIAILEDTGYMARVSFMMDRIMRKVGLNGKSVVPLISGVACAVPAIMATRTIENTKDRLITILVTPLMSCSARLPVYTLMISLFVPQGYLYGLFDYRGLCLLAMYLIGFLSAISASWILKLVIRSKSKSYFMLELPIYRLPLASHILYTLVQKGKTFLFEAGKVIIAVSLILWVLGSFGPGDRFDRIDTKYDRLMLLKTKKPLEINLERKSEKLENSYAGILGHALEPIIKPLGYDWKIGIALIASFAAREVFVGTMSTLYSVQGDKDNEGSIREEMQKAKNPITGKPVFSLAVAFSLMIFYAFAMQCASTLAVVKRETKSWSWPAFQFAYMTGLAYLFSFIIYQTLK